jgi:predicted GIY-YIG superfamily endonuclease
MPFWTYILHCRGGKFYTGHTDDLERRIGQHQSGLIPGFTSEHLPVKLVWSEEFPTRYEALTAERQIKGWGREKKMALIRGDWDLVSRLAKSRTLRSDTGQMTNHHLPRSVHPERPSPQSRSG